MVLTLEKNVRKNMPWFVKIESGIVEKPVFDRHVPAHKAYVQTLIDRGHKAKTGYWAKRGGGMLLFEADSLEEAQAIVDRDPLVQNGCVTYELYEWHIVVGD
jgi:uncharacterized protein YciI